MLWSDTKVLRSSSRRSRTNKKQARLSLRRSLVAPPPFRCVRRPLERQPSTLGWPMTHGHTHPPVLPSLPQLIHKRPCVTWKPAWNPRSWQSCPHLTWKWTLLVPPMLVLLRWNSRLTPKLMTMPVALKPSSPPCKLIWHVNWTHKANRSKAFLLHRWLRSRLCWQRSTERNDGPATPLLAGVVAPLTASFSVDLWLLPALWVLDFVCHWLILVVLTCAVLVVLAFGFLPAWWLCAVGFVCALALLCARVLFCVSPLDPGLLPPSPGFLTSRGAAVEMCRLVSSPGSGAVLICFPGGCVGVCSLPVFELVKLPNQVLLGPLQLPIWMDSTTKLLGWPMDCMTLGFYQRRIWRLQVPKRSKPPCDKLTAPMDPLSQVVQLQPGQKFPILANGLELAFCPSSLSAGYHTAGLLPCTTLVVWFVLLSVRMASGFLEWWSTVPLQVPLMAMAEKWLTLCSPPRWTALNSLLDPGMLLVISTMTGIVCPRSPWCIGWATEMCKTCVLKLLGFYLKLPVGARPDVTSCSCPGNLPLCSFLAMLMTSPCPITPTWLGFSMVALKRSPGLCGRLLTLWNGNLPMTECLFKLSSSAQPTVLRRTTISFGKKLKPATCKLGAVRANHASVPWLVALLNQVLSNVKGLWPLSRPAGQVTGNLLSLGLVCNMLNGLSSTVVFSRMSAWLRLLSPRLPIGLISFSFGLPSEGLMDFPPPFLRGGRLDTSG